ncbi:MAG: hypothetical protein EOO70_04145 [Myxococcaceae bacterium]|nr:MAG: hypothetical protein EOO70_04145 [Myxococcaceae bacterium]
MPTTPEALIAELERQIAEDKPMFDSLLTALGDCDSRQQFAVALDALPDLPPRPVRAAPARPVLAHFIRA